MKKLIKILLLSLMVIIDAVFNGCSEDANNVIAPPGAAGNSVSGNVISQTGLGLSGVRVNIGNSEATTDQNGNFAIEGVSIPYNANLVSGTEAVSYKGLSSTSPKLTFNSSSNSYSNSATLNVSCPILMNEDEYIHLVFTDGRSIQFNQTMSFPAGSANITVRWNGSSAITGKAIALKFISYDGLVSINSYEGYAEKLNIQLVNGATQSVAFSDADLAQRNPDEAIISGTISTPGGFTQSSSRLYLKFTSEDVTYPDFGGFCSSDNNFNFKVPTGLNSQARFAIVATARNLAENTYTEKAVVVQAGSTGHNIVLENGPVLISPVNGATGINLNTDFSFSGGSGVEIYKIIMSGLNNSYTIYTSDLSSKIPDLSHLGIMLAPNSDYHWRVEKINDVSSTDQIVTSPLFQNSRYSGIAQSYSNTFTTAP